MQINITNGTLTSIQETLSPVSGYELPPVATISGATSSYNSSTGVITLTSPTSSMSITASAVARSITNFSDFCVKKLVGNVLTLDGVAYTLDGVTTGSDEVESSFKTLSAEVDDTDGAVTLTIGNATIVMDDINLASNFELADGNYIETSNGLLFNVAES